jgi:hypothetical protein
VRAYQGKWFGTDMFPGIAVYNLPHPRDFDKDISSIKRGRLKQGLLFFKNEYFGKSTKAGRVLAAPKKVLNVLDLREKERKDNKPVTGLSL